MPKPTLNFPSFARGRGPFFWLNPRNLWHSRESFTRADYSNERRRNWRAQQQGVSLTKDVNDLLFVRQKNSATDYSFIIIGDTGEGDRSQYATLPLIKALNPDYMIINGDVAYPAGRLDMNDTKNSDYHQGFFEPYRNLGIPIWATPGNHEFYSPAEGQEFFNLFCTSLHEQLWQQYGLPSTARTRQPMSYWEIMDSNRNFSVIGLDTGKTANLDGEKSWWQFWKKVSADDEQIAWFDATLRRNNEQNISTLVLFHIPALVNAKEKEGKLKKLHQKLSLYPCVKGVIASHVHNIQIYEQEAWAKFLHNYSGSSPQNAAMPYIVCGSGGASLHATDFKTDAYSCTVYPTSQDWRDYKMLATRLLNSLGMGSSLLIKISSDIEDMIADTDPAKYFSLLHIQVSAQHGVRCTPYFVEDLEAVYKAAYGEKVVVDIAANAPPLSAAHVAGSALTTIQISPP